MKKVFLLCMAAAALHTARAEKVDVTRLYYSGAQQTHAPFVADSTDVKGEKESDLALLKTVFFSNAPAKGQWITAPDSLVIGTAGTRQLHQIQCYLDAARYTGGKLYVHAPKVARLRVDGKETAISPDGTKLSLTPGRHTLLLECLTDQSPSAVRIAYDAEKENCVTDGGDSKHGMTIDYVMDGKRISKLAVSPDGNYVLVGYTDVYPGGKTVYSYEVRDTEKNNLICRPRQNAEWMPTGSTLLYSVNGTQGKELRTLNPGNLKEECLTILPEHCTDYLPDPAGRFLTVTLEQEGPEERKIAQQILEPDDRIPGWRTRTNLYRLDLQTGLLQPLTYGHSNIRLCDLSSDGKQILFMISREDVTRRPFTFNTLYLMDLSTQETQTLVEKDGFLQSAQFSPDGKQILLQGGPEALGGTGLNVKEGQTANLFDNQLFLMEIASRKITPLTRDFNPSVNQATWRSYDNQIYFSAEDKDYVRLFKLNPADGNISRLPIEVEVVARYSVADKAPQIGYYGQSISTPSQAYIYNPKKKSNQRVASSVEEEFAGRLLGEAHDWDYVNSRGDTITGRYYLPPHFDASRKYPMIVYYYGGCSPVSRNLENAYAGHLFAAYGYVVYVLQPSGATGFGQEFSARHVNAWGDYSADDIIEGTKRFCNEHSFVDANKVGCCGASYGGFMTQTLQTKTDFFAAAISHAGISNVTSYWGEGYWGYSYSACATADRYPWTDPDLYTRHSPLFNADKVKTPLLFLHGTADTNVPIGESIQMFNALKILGKETAFVQIEGENHHILTYDKRKLWQNTMFAWFAKYLQDDPDWWDALYAPKDLK